MVNNRPPGRTIHVSYHRTEAERLLELLDPASLAPGDLAALVLAHAVLAVDDSIIESTTATINPETDPDPDAAPFASGGPRYVHR
jgi:hypothetical protein